MPEKGRIPISS